MNVVRLFIISLVITSSLMCIFLSTHARVLLKNYYAKERAAMQLKMSVSEQKVLLSNLIRELSINYSNTHQNKIIETINKFISAQRNISSLVPIEAHLLVNNDPELIINGSSNSSDHLVPNEKYYAALTDHHGITYSNIYHSPVNNNIELVNFSAYIDSLGTIEFVYLVEDIIAQIDIPELYQDLTLKDLSTFEFKINYKSLLQFYAYDFSIKLIVFSLILGVVLLCLKEYIRKTLRFQKDRKSITNLSLQAKKLAETNADLKTKLLSYKLQKEVEEQYALLRTNTTQDEPRVSCQKLLQDITKYFSYSLMKKNIAISIDSVDCWVERWESFYVLASVFELILHNLQDKSQISIATFIQNEYLSIRITDDGYYNMIDSPKNARTTILADSWPKIMIFAKSSKIFISHESQGRKNEYLISIPCELFLFEGSSSLN